jgi:cysteine-rich repeat protein
MVKNNLKDHFPMFVLTLVAITALIVLTNSLENNITGGPIVGCFDSDADENFYRKGYTQYRDEKFYDYCSGNKLFQYYCKSSVKVARIQGYTCANGCYDGRCLSLQDNCGNGVVDDQERCDDGNNKNGDGCSDGCLIETGFTCSPVSICTLK